MNIQEKAELIPAKNNSPIVGQEVTPMAMLQMAVQQDADLDKLQKLMELQERWEANQARRAFVSAMAAFKADPPELFKNKHTKFITQKNTTIEYDHPSLDHIAAAIGEKMPSHGLNFRWDINQLDSGLIKVICILTHSAGHSESTSIHAGADQSGSKNNIQAIGSTITYLQRYTLLAATGLATKDMDDDGNGSESIERITPKQIADLDALIEEVGADKAAFLRYVNAKSIDDIQASFFDNAVHMLEQKRRYQRNNNGH